MKLLGFKLTVCDVALEVALYRTWAVIELNFRFRPNVQLYFHVDRRFPWVPAVIWEPNDAGPAESFVANYGATGFKTQLLLTVVSLHD